MRQESNQNDSGQTDVTAGLSNVVAVAGGWEHSLALRADGSVAAWGANYFGQTNVPPGLSNVIAVSGGGNHSLALVAPQPVFLRQPVSRTNSINTVATFSVTATGNAPLTYHWRRNGTNLMDGPNIFGAAAASLTIANVQSSDAGNYTVVVTNAYGSVTSLVATLTVVTTLGDDFSSAYPDPTRWGPDIHLGAGSQLVQTNGRLQFQGGATVLRPWIGGYGSYEQDWEVIADVNVGNVALTQNKAYARVFFGVADHHDLLIQNGWPGDVFSIALNVYYETPGPIDRVFESVVQTNGVVVSTLQGTQNTTNQHAGLRISFSAATKTLTAWHDVGGSTNSHTWVPLSSLRIDGGDVNWDMTDASAFRFALGASSRSFTVSASDQVYADNFAVVGGVQLGAPLFSDPGNFTWARRVAKTGLPNGELALGTAVDAATNIYVTGWFDGSNDFGGTTLTSYGGQDGFVAKYNSTGALQWVRQVGGTNVEPMNTDYWDAARAVGVDGAGNVYVAGGFLGQATFSGAVLTSQGLQDAFLAKYSAAGQPQWVRQGGDASGRTYATGIAVDAAGDCLMVGCFNGQRASFGSTTANNPGYLNGAYGAFIAKFNNAGVPLWAQGLGGGDTYSTTVGMDAGGNCFVGGGFENTLQIGATNLTSAGGKDGFLAKFNSAGVLQWVRQVKGASMDGGRVGVDASGNCFFIGSLPAGVLDFGGQTITNTNASAMYVAKYDTLGGLLWVRQAEGTGVFMGSDGGCAVDQAGSCYIPGVFVGSATFGATTVTNRGGSDIFVAKYDAAGNFKWVQTAGGSLGDAALRLAADAGGTCYVAGWFQWIPAFGTNLLQAQGFRDVFLAKLAEPTIPLQFCFLSVSKGIFQTRLDGTPGASVIVDTSSDLTTWTPWRTNTLPAGGLTLAMPIGPNRQFFRARIP